MSSPKPSTQKRRDKHRKARGGSSHFLHVYCATCREPVLLYQKDGPGGLLRLYLDRILAPGDLAELLHQCDDKADVPNLACPSCGSVIGVPMVHAKDKRLAFRLIKGRFFRQKSDGAWPPG